MGPMLEAYTLARPPDHLQASHPRAYGQLGAEVHSNVIANTKHRFRHSSHQKSEKGGEITTRKERHMHHDAWLRSHLLVLVSA